MKNHIINLALFMILILGCKTISKKESNNISNSKNCIVNSEELYTANQEWACYLNNNIIDSLQNIYVTYAIKVETSGIVLTGTSDILKNYIDNPIKIDTIWTIKNVIADKNKNYEYEIGAFKTYGKRTFKHLLIWNTSNNNKKREFEFIANSEIVGTAVAQINERREKWVELCNLHDVRTLVEQLYTKNSVYFNHKPAIIGLNSIVEEYQYMNNENYQLSLEPIKVEMVNEELAYEIGQCTGSYNGKYILIWQKDDLGEWRILVDSNI